MDSLKCQTSTVSPAEPGDYLFYLRPTYTIYLLNAGAEWVDIQALRGHATLTTTPIDTNVDQDRMAAVVARL